MTPNTTTTCPHCFNPHEVPRCSVGEHLWNLCERCLAAEDRRLAQTLRQRGIKLVRLVAAADVK